jgi:hypothetical protein
MLDFNISQWNGTKSLIISSSNPLGDNSFYGYALIIAAGYCLLVNFILWILLITSYEKKFDYSLLKWK